MILRYIPQPIKPGYNYDVYGFCWGLSANSCISRTIEYLPDETRNFMIDTNFSNKYYDDSPNLINEANWAHDKFNVTLPNGSSFEFVIDNDGKNNLNYTISNGRNVKISCTYSVYNIESFVIVDESGVKYTFSYADTSFTGLGSYQNDCYDVSWHLTRIDLPYSSEPIILSYDKLIETESYKVNVQEPVIKISHEYFASPEMYGKLSHHHISANVSYVNPQYFHHMSLLTSINYGTTTISFDYCKAAFKAHYNYINQISIKDDNTLIRNILFKYRKNVYHGTVDTLSMLTQLSISGNGPYNNPEVYSLDYESGSSSLSHNTDHWGYLNLKGTNYDVAKMNFFLEFDSKSEISYLPVSQITKTEKDLNPYQKLQLMRSDCIYDPRESASPEDHNILTQIIYPTGGYTNFDFENNRFLTRTDENGDYIRDKNKRRIIEGGGFRIKSITNYTSDNKIANVKYIYYGRTYAEENKLNGYNPYMAKFYPNEYTGLGEAVVDPNIFTYLNFSEDETNQNLRYMVEGLNEIGEYKKFSNPFQSVEMTGYHDWYWEITFSPLNFRSILNGRTPVVYSDITESYIDKSGQQVPQNSIGKIVSKYDIYVPQQYDTVFFEAPQYYENKLT
ncbi:MAG TPA: hypothetical protein PLF38_03615, partial [Xylanibacter oryzae]|nr:hypothetical protein [Xylanibacter oryzae]